MAPSPEKIVLNGMPSQIDRRQEALAPDHVLVDARTPSQLLDFGVRVAALFNFYDLSDSRDGRWLAFFLTDPVMVIASIESAVPSALDATFTALVREAREAPAGPGKLRALARVFDDIRDLAQLFDRWLCGVGDDQPGGAAPHLRNFIITAIDTSLGAALRALIAYGEGAATALGQAIPVDTRGFLPLWGTGDVRPDDSIYRGYTQRQKIDHALPKLTALYESFATELNDLRALVSGLGAAARRSGDTKPHLALFIAFVEIFGHAQRSLNRFNGRYVDFYYEDVLRERPAGAWPDSVYLTFALAPSEEVLRSKVPRGTLFSAGADSEGHPIVYASDRDLVVGALALGALRMLRVVRGPLFLAEGSPPPDLAPEVITGVVATTVDLESETYGVAPFPTFGAATAGETSVARAAPATMGFAVASPYLLLTGGQRTATLAVRAAAAYVATILEPRLALLAAATGLSEAEVYEAVLDAAFRLYVSTSAGWVPVEYHVTVPITPGGVADLARYDIVIELPPTGPALRRYDPEDPDPPDDEVAAKSITLDPVVLATNPDPSSPTVKLYLVADPMAITTTRGTVLVHALSLLAEQVIETIQLRVRVLDLPAHDLESTSGPVDDTSPFAVFGGSPVLRSYLDVRMEEIFVKKPRSLSLRLDWFDLPPYDTGFLGYYRYYTIGLDGKPQPDLFDNRTFRVDIVVVSPGTWKLGGIFDSPLAPGEYYLFRTDGGADPPAPAAPVDPATTFVDLPIETHTAPAYYDPRKSAVRIELAAPTYAFGEDLYPINVLNCVIADLPDPTRCQALCEARFQDLATAAEMLGSALEVCGGRPADAILPCLEASLVPILAYLEEALANCLAREPSSPPCCDALAAAIACIRRCQEEALASPPDPARVVFCLTGCKAALVTAYRESVATCVAACVGEKPELKYPNPPWLPQGTRVTIDYTAECAVFGGEGADGQLHHLLPFDGYRLVPPDRAAPTLLPVPAHPGSVLLGFSGLHPPEPITFLFQMDALRPEDSDTEPPVVSWGYLVGNRWAPLRPADIRSDTTNDLGNTGIVTLSLPSYDPGTSTALPGDLRWLRIIVNETPGRFPDTLAITPNVVIATWQPGDGTGEHLERGLPAHTITSAVEDLPYVGEIDQPMASFGGRPRETRETFGIRLGERLRHKDRAIQSWDYERLVLARFPAIFAARALPARTPRRGDSPGDVLVVVLPGPGGTDGTDVTMPLAAPFTLSQIQASLAQSASPFVRIHVVNPVYVRIHVTVTVMFRDPDDAGAGADALNADLIAYLSPWPTSPARIGRGGDYASEASISEFVQTRPYVASMVEIDFAYTPDPEGLSWYLLTSATSHTVVDADARPVEVPQDD